MKRYVFLCVSAVIMAVALTALAFFPVSTRQGVNYAVRTISIPLYIKAIEYVDRDYHYRRIVREVTAGREAGESVSAIFRWCVDNVKHQPKELPIIDDHPLNIIVRGYGGADQLEDIFTVLCTYAGFDAFYRAFSGSDGRTYFISFVKIKGRWYPFSAYKNIDCLSGEGSPSLDDFLKSPKMLASFGADIDGFDAHLFIEEVGRINFDDLPMRVRAQSPLGRLCYFFKRK